MDKKKYATLSDLNKGTIFKLYTNSNINMHRFLQKQIVFNPIFARIYNFFKN